MKQAAGEAFKHDPASTHGRPLVAIVGRPNVGKSSLFNRLAATRNAIVEDTPGVTRDRLYAPAEALGHGYLLVDTGGFDPGAGDPLFESIAEQVELAVSEASLVICVLDSRTGATAADREAIALLRRSTRPVIYAANKVDTPAQSGAALDLYRFGMPEVVAVSALHGHGLGEIEEAIARALPERAPAPSEQAVPGPAVAVVGRPNAGKSSLVNRLLGQPRQIVDARPGTTVDSVDTPLVWGDRRYLLTDTAGMRRRRAVKEPVEAISILHALRAIERSHAVVLVVDAERGAAEQDAKIAGFALERGRAIVIALNKIDAVERAAGKQLEQRTREVLGFMSFAPLQRISALEGSGVGGLMNLVAAVVQNHQKRVATAELNRFFEQVLQKHPPPTRRGRPVRIYYVSQVRTRPPTFVASTNRPDLVHFSYRRYVVNQLRARFGFEGTPIRVLYRKRGRRK
ncbi:MAG: ribosome biogenesis GTPase Der [Proteobacteria bacterium]|nr:ribosome biogenesis GTPase Der [Pseudomonadota bacterium]